MGGKGSGNRTYSNPVVANKGSSVDPDSNRRTIAYTLALNDLPAIDRGEEEEARRRVEEFFALSAEHGMRPMVGGLAIAFKIDKVTLWRIANDIRSGSGCGFTPTTAAILKNALMLIDTNFEQLLMDAKNPVPAIFYTKSNLGWREAASETVITHRSEKPQLEGRTTAEIAAGIAELVGVEDVKKLTD